MRNWFILFATTFTITTLTLTITTVLVPHLPIFNNEYIILLAISSSLISLCILLFDRLPIESIVLNVSLDIFFIFLIVYVTGMLINFIPLTVANFIVVLGLVIIIYIIITLIYLFILRKEAEQMNKKIIHWRKNHVKSEPFK